MTFGIYSTGREASDFIGLRKLCALEFDHISAKSFKVFCFGLVFFFFFLPLQSRDPRKDQRTEYLVEGEWVLPLKGRYPPSHFQICKVSWQRLETWLTKEAEFHWDRWTVRILYLHLLWWNVVRKREEIRHFESVFLKSQVTDDKSSQTSPTIHI